MDIQIPLFWIQWWKWRGCYNSLYSSFYFASRVYLCLANFNATIRRPPFYLEKLINRIVARKWWYESESCIHYYYTMKLNENWMNTLVVRKKRLWKFIATDEEFISVCNSAFDLNAFIIIIMSQECASVRQQHLYTTFCQDLHGSSLSSDCAWGKLEKEILGDWKNRATKS